MTEVTLTNGVLMPVAGRGEFPSDGRFVSVVSGGGMVSGWLAVDPARRADDAADRRVSVAVLPADGAVWVSEVTARQVEPSDAPGGDAGTWLSTRELGALRSVVSARVELLETRADAQRQRERRESWLESLVSDAHEWADSNSLCGEFDRFMDEHGLPGRDRDYEVTVDVTVTTRLTITRTASSADSAEGLIDSSDVEEELRDRLGSYGQSLDFDVSDWEIDGTEQA
ncbi:hypothetical protein ACFYVR_26290 [Rhodococcus sp. NPDC003318]|uniref:hypothetical protein n=1 Tax=Rhodococcus sp. NPDC003318 TaxID=3364503 RepID=UPI0036878B4E